MRQFNKILIPALAAAIALGTANPAAARATPNRAEAIRSEIGQLQRAVNRNDNRDRISEREAAGLRRDVSVLQQQFRAYNRDGLSNREWHALQNRIQNIRARLQVERRDHDGQRGDHGDHRY